MEHHERRSIGIQRGRSSARTMSEQHARSPLRRSAGWLAGREPLPLAVRAVMRYYASTGVVDVPALRLRGTVEDEVAAIIDDAFAAVEDALAAELALADPRFEYETKLTLPVELTLGYCYRRADDDATRERAREVAVLVTEALLDGDMRDAINDDEYGDFEVEAQDADPDPAEVAPVAQQRLSERVLDRFGEYPDGVQAAYDWAVEVSERHQDEDSHFRELLERAREDDDDAREAIEDEYKFAPIEAADYDLGDGYDASVLGAEERALPYCRTQYERVGVIYDGMVEMFREAGIDVEEGFKRSVVLAIVGAQVWLDDVDDFEADMAEGQLTPVTAEYLVRDDERAAYEAVGDVTSSYLDAAVEHATASGSPLTGIATEYIYLSGDPEVLPGSG
jgi:hypothetical protein